MSARNTGHRGPRPARQFGLGAAWILGGLYGIFWTLVAAASIVGFAVGDIAAGSAIATVATASAPPALTAVAWFTWRRLTGLSPAIRGLLQGLCVVPLLVVAWSWQNPFQLYRAEEIGRAEYGLLAQVLATLFVAFAVEIRGGLGRARRGRGHRRHVCNQPAAARPRRDGGRGRHPMLGRNDERGRPRGVPRAAPGREARGGPAPSNERQVKRDVGRHVLANWRGTGRKARAQFGAREALVLQARCGTGGCHTPASLPLRAN
jgi:hypothetical protein